MSERVMYYCRCGWCGAYEGTVDPTEPCAEDPVTLEPIGPHQFGVYERATQDAGEPVALRALLDYAESHHGPQHDNAAHICLTCVAEFYRSSAGEAYSLLGFAWEEGGAWHLSTSVHDAEIAAGPENVEAVYRRRPSAGDEGDNEHIDKIRATTPTIHRFEGEGGGYVWTCCPECGPDVTVDEDGCCQMCGYDAVFYGNAPRGEAAVPRDKVEALVAAADDLVDEDGYLGDLCRYDHHGWCQEHGMHDRPCPVERIRAALDAIKESP